MRWEGRRESQNVEDRRSMSTGGKVLAGGSLLGVVILVVVNLLFGNGDPVNIQLPQPAQQQSSRPLSASEQAADDQRASFVKVVLADTEDVWSKLFAKSGQRYPAPTLVLFRDRVQSACGNASAASGPFYCPADQKLYIDLSFYEELQTRFKAPGEFSMAYVVAHEVGQAVANQSYTGLAYL